MGKPFLCSFSHALLKENNDNLWEIIKKLNKIMEKYTFYSAVRDFLNFYFDTGDRGTGLPGVKKFLP